MPYRKGCVCRCRQGKFPWQHKDVYGKIQKKCEGPESKDLTWEIMRDIWRGQCGSEASRPGGDSSNCFEDVGSLEVSVMNKGNRIKVGEPD